MKKREGGRNLLSEDILERPCRNLFSCSWNPRKKKGMGTLLLNHTLSEAKKMGITTVFVLTYVPGFFAENGFEEIDKSKLPQKIWGECIRCHKFPVCDESAMVKYLE